MGNGRSIRRELGAVVRLATPVILVQVGMVLMGAVDTMMLGRVSETDLAAGSIGNALSIAVIWSFIGILLAIDPMAAQAFGAGDHRRIRRVLCRGAGMAVLLSVPATLIVLGLDRALPLTGQPQAIVEPAAAYLRGIGPGVIAFLLFMCLRQTLQAMSIVRPALIAIGVANVFNAIANWALIFGHLGFPALGVRGSAYATSGSRWVMLIVVAAFGWRHLRRYVGGWRWSWLRPAALRPFLFVGVPIAVQVSLEVTVFSFAAVLIGRLGEAQLSGHQVAISLASISFMVPLGFAGAATTRVGNAIGRRDPVGARRSALVCLSLGAGVMVAFGLVFFSLPQLLARVFSDVPAVVAAAAALIPIAGLFQVADGLQVAAAGVLRGAADTRFPAAVALVGYWVIGMPAGVWLTFERGLGPSGVWWGLTFGLVFVAIFLAFRVRWRLWRSGAVGLLPAEAVDDD